jgi:hypothetical protein
MIGEVGDGLGHVAAVAGRADAAALAGEGHDESRAARHADRAGEAEAEEPAREIAAEFVLDVSRHGPHGGFPPGEPAGRLLMARAVPGTIHDVERLARVGQRHSPNHVAPLVLVVDVHALLALAGRLDRRGVHIDRRDVKKVSRLLTPDFHAGVVEHLLQHVDASFIKSAAEVTCGRRIGNPGRAQCIEIPLVVPLRSTCSSRRAILCLRDCTLPSYLGVHSKLLKKRRVA